MHHTGEDVAAGAREPENPRIEAQLDVRAVVLGDPFGLTLLEVVQSVERASRSRNARPDWRRSAAASWRAFHLTRERRARRKGHKND